MSDKLFADIVEALLWLPDDKGGIIPMGRREAEAIAPWVNVMIDRARRNLEEERDALRERVSSLESELLAARTDRGELADELQSLRDWRNRLADKRAR